MQLHIAEEQNLCITCLDKHKAKISASKQVEMLHCANM